MWRIRIVLAAFVSVWASSAAAQVVAPPNYWAHGTELAVHTGVASSPSATGATVGGSARWDVTRWVAVEGRASWLDRGADAQGFAADVSGLLNLVPREAITPFVGAGVGLYRASFDSAQSAMSDFYRLRMTPQFIGGTRAFTDPTLRMTAGFDFIGEPRRQQWTVRPELSVLVVYANGRNEKIVSGTVSIGYRFHAPGAGD